MNNSLRIFLPVFGVVLIIAGIVLMVLNMVPLPISIALIGVGGILIIVSIGIRKKRS
jgi:multisubunit Na+/H+ antiporter MnhC subunit